MTVGNEKLMCICTSFYTRTEVRGARANAHQLFASEPSPSCLCNHRRECRQTARVLALWLISGGCRSSAAASSGLDGALQLMKLWHFNTLFSKRAISKRVPRVTGIFLKMASRSCVSGCGRFLETDGRSIRPSASPRASHSSSTSHHLVFLDELAGPSDRAGPSISFGAPADDRMSIAASEGELGSGDDDSAVLPPSGRVAWPESDPELTAMLSRAAESVGLHWRPPSSSRMLEAGQLVPEGIRFHLCAGQRCSCLACRDHGPAGERRDTAGPSIRDEVRVLQSLLHLTHEGGSLVPLRKQAFAFSTTSTTGSYWPSLVRSCANTGTRCSVPFSRLGLWGQLGKEQTLPCAEDLVSKHGVGLGQPHSTSLNRTCSVDAELPGVFPAQEGSSTETVSEAPGAYGIRSCCHAAQVASYETASALASRRGTYWVSVTPSCHQTFSPWSDIAFLRAGVPLVQVSRHIVVSTDASAVGWGAMCNGHAAAGLWTGPRLQ